MFTMPSTGWRSIVQPKKSAHRSLFACSNVGLANTEQDYELDSKIKSFFDKVLYGAYKQVDSRSAMDARAHEKLGKTTFHHGPKYYVTMLWTGFQGTAFKLTVNGIKKELFYRKFVHLTVTPHKNRNFEAFTVRPYVRKTLTVRFRHH